ncbi:MAG: hypothetical protein P1U74_10215 [Legionellaceae bacterium]|nr:hypothetical protein [Legionellaceae bacterium]
MPRLTISLSQGMYNRLSSLAIQCDVSLSNIVNKLVQIGMQHLGEEEIKSHNLAEKHCQQLIIQINALLKNVSAEILQFKQEDFEMLREASAIKYNELLNNRS